MCGCGEARSGKGADLTKKGDKKPTYYYCQTKKNPPPKKMSRFLSLGKRKTLTLALFGILFGLWLLLFVLNVELWIVLVFTALVNVHAVAVWVYFIWSFARPRARILAPVTLVRPVLLFIVTVLAMSALHASILRADSASYAGVPPGTNAWGEWGVGVFLAIETMATLGSGTIPARTAASLAAVAYNCVASLAYSLFAFGLVMVVLGGSLAKRLAGKG